MPVRVALGSTRIRHCGEPPRLPIRTRLPSALPVRLSAIASLVPQEGHAADFAIVVGLARAVPLASVALSFRGRRGGAPVVRLPAAAFAGRRDGLPGEP